MTTLSNDFRCPVDAGRLVERGPSLHCQRCSRDFPVEEGIFDFRGGDRDYYFNPVPRKEMAELHQMRGMERWPEKIRQFVQSTSNIPGWLDNLVVDGRYAWKLFLDLKPDSQVLDLGCGLGNLTSNIAPHVRRVFALDRTYERLEFARDRFSIFNPDDDIVVLAGGDTDLLPFPEDSLDCVILSGVLEWVGEGDMEPFLEGTKWKRTLNMLTYHFGARSPRSIQLRFLKEIRRVLKPSGQLFVAIENRFSYAYFGGRPDHHSGLMLGSLLPRLLANLYSIAKTRRPYRTYTHSIWGYERLFRQAGFPETEFLGLEEGYSDLREILPAKLQFPAWKPLRASTAKERLKRHRVFVPAFGIIAGGATQRPRLQDELLARTESLMPQTRSEGGLLLETYEITSKDKLIIRSSLGSANVIIKVPLNAATIALEQNNMAMLRHPELSNHPLLPRSLGYGEARRVTYFVEERVPGQPLARLLRSWGRTSMLPQVADLLASLNPEPVKQGFRPLDGAVFEKQVTQPLTKLLPLVQDLGAWQALGAYFKDALYGQSILIGKSHGDFTLSNIFAKDAEISGLIDWEAGSPSGLPLLDAVSFLISAENHFSSETNLASSVSSLARGQWEVPEEWSFLQGFYERFGTDPNCHAALVYLSWLQAMAFRARCGLGYDPRAIDFFITQVLNTVPAGAMA